MVKMYGFDDTRPHRVAFLYHDMLDLNSNADALQAGASQFEASAGKLKNKYWWKNCKVCN